MRASIRAQVERCAYVERVDAQQQREPSATFDSFRKYKWLQQKALRDHSVAADDLLRYKEIDERAFVERGALCIHEQLAQQLHHAAEAMAQKRAEKERRRLEAAALTLAKSGDRRDFFVPLAFEAFLEEIQESDVDVRCSGSPLPVIPFDRLGAISVPSRREGNSLTLCCWEQDTSENVGEVVVDELEDSSTNTTTRNEQLVVFGGRVLQDVSVLVPAAVQKDPMKFERVRYTYSNGVYAYDIATSVWRFHECSGRAPRERSDHCAVFLEPRFLVVCGGRGRNGQIFRDTFALDVLSWQWMMVNTETRIIERYWHGCCVAQESVVVFGGKSDVVTHGDLQLLDASVLRNHLLSLLDPTSSQAASTEPTPPVDKKDKKVKFKASSLAWICPHTVGRAPSPRFGMAVIALGSERIAVVGGHKAPKNKAKTKHEFKPSPRLMDVYILDTVAFIWSSPRLSSHVSMRTAAPTERMLFECFCHQHTLIVFGGFTYVTTSESESCTPRVDGEDPVVFKLDVNRMIWRRQVVEMLPVPHIHASANAVLGARAFTCGMSDQHTLLELLDFRIDRAGIDTNSHSS